jgi:hypothetical protein
MRTRCLRLVALEEVGNQAAEQSAVFRFRQAPERQATVDAQALAGDERSVVAQQEDDAPRDVLRFAETR